MLHRELLEKELGQQAEDFKDFEKRQGADTRRYLGLLEELSKTPLEAIKAKLSDIEEPGALPSQEIAAARKCCIEFHEKWNNHEEARAWAMEALRERTTFAADASQMLLDQEVNMPIGVIQVGWFENPHCEGRRYEKMARPRFLSPRELLETQEDPINYKSRIELERFRMEVEAAEKFLNGQAGWRARGERMPLAFYDGTLLFSVPIDKKSKIEYVNKLHSLVMLSEKTEVPLIGYIAHSKTRDLLNMLDHFAGGKPGLSKSIFDADILRPRPGDAPAFKNWGDRSAFFYSRRIGLSEIFKDSAGFIYIQMSGDTPPARLDIPSWIYEKGLLEEVADVARAEAIIGLGYPYCLETADQMAVISAADRDILLRVLQDFAARQRLDFKISRKTASKGRRR